MIALVHFTSNNLHVHSFQRALSAIVVLCTVLFKSGLTLTTASPDMLTRMTRESFLAHLLVNHRKLTVNGDEQGFVRFEQQHFCSVTGRQTSPCSTNFFPKSQREFNVVALPQQQTLSEKVCHLYEDCESIMKFVHSSTRFSFVQNLGNFHTFSNPRAHEGRGILSEQSWQDYAVDGHYMKRKESTILDLSFTTLHDNDNVYNVYNKKRMVIASPGRFSFAILLIFHLTAEKINSYMYVKIRSFLYNKNTNERTLNIDSELSEKVFSAKIIFPPTQCNFISLCLRKSITPNLSFSILMEIQPQQNISDAIRELASILDIPEFFLTKFCSFKIDWRAFQTLEQKQLEQCFSSYVFPDDELLDSSAPGEPDHDNGCDLKKDKTDECSSEVIQEQQLPMMMCETMREKFHRRGPNTIGFPGTAMQQQQPPMMTCKNLQEISRNNPDIMVIFMEIAIAILQAAAAEGSAGAAAGRATSSSESSDSKSKASNKNKPERIQMRFGNVNHEFVWFYSCVQGCCELPAAYMEKKFASKLHSLRNIKTDNHRLSTWIKTITCIICFHSVPPKMYQDDERFSSPFSSYLMKQVGAIPSGITTVREKSFLHDTPSVPGRHGHRRHTLPVYVRKPNAVASRQHGLYMVMYARSSPTVT